MKERPILFSGPMVRAILEGRKTQTRRVIKWRGVDGFNLDFSGLSASNIAGAKWALMSMGASCWQERGHALCPYGVPGDRLWVRESLRCENDFADFGAGPVDAPYYVYAADGCAVDDHTPAGHPRKKHVPSIHMPRWASRITLEITDVRVQRAQEISGSDSLAEGITIPRCGCEVCAHSAEMCPADASAAILEYASLWDSINSKKHPWTANPWVWALTFKRVVAEAQ